MKNISRTYTIHMPLGGLLLHTCYKTSTLYLSYVVVAWKEKTWLSIPQNYTYSYICHCPSISVSWWNHGSNISGAIHTLSARTKEASSTMAGLVLGMASTIVIPPARAAAVPELKSSLCVAPGSRKWTWTSIKPVENGSQYHGIEPYRGRYRSFAQS